MSELDMPVDTSLEEALGYLHGATFDMPDGAEAVRTVRAEIDRLRENNHRLGLARVGAESKVNRLLALIRPVQDAYARCASYDHTTDERLREAGLDRIADALSVLDTLDAS